MKKNLMDLIEKLEMELTRKDGEWAISVPAKNKPSQEEVKTIIGNKQEIINILQEQKRERIAIEKQKEEEKKNVNVKVEWKEEFPHMAYEVIENEELLLELGLARNLGNWGVKVDKEVIEALGTEFTAQEARDYANRNLKKEEEIITKEEKLENLKETAKVLGHKVEVRSYNVECNGMVAECDTDIITEYIDSKGRLTKTRVHTH